MARIPKTLHYIFGMTPTFGNKPWSLIHHVCLRSALERIQPDQTFLYYAYEPQGPWWQLSRELVTLKQIEAPTAIFGNALDHPAHRADVIRLQALIEHGGIYLDADVFVQRSFDALLDNSTVLGQEDAGDGIGMANAVILAEPQAPFLIRWLEEFRSFDGSRWNEHAVKLPARLAAAHPDEITVLPPDAFFWPTYLPADLDRLFNSPVPIPLGGAYANHLWESEAWSRVRGMTPGEIRQRGGNFQKWAEPLLAGLPDHLGTPSLLQRVKWTGKDIVRAWCKKLRG
jgi:Glycosyltransferase sugar-binding region containing DXD motif